MRRREFLAIACATALAPLATAAQAPGKVHRIAILAPTGPVAVITESGVPLFKTFFAELRRLGYVEGRNLVVERRSAEGDANRLPALGRELAALKPDVMVASTTPAIAALKAATTTIPIVALAGDPVGFGFAISLVRPGGNITGFTPDAGLEITGKRIELLKRAVPTISRMAYLAPRGRGTRDGRPGHAFLEAAKRLGITPVEAPVEHPTGEAAFRSAFAAMVAERVDSIYVMGAADNYTHRRLIAELADQARLPAIHYYREAVEAGGLMAYAFDIHDIFRRMAGYVDLIFKGASPAELPFQQPTKFELVINMKTAKALGLTVPPSMLGIADEVIE